MNIAFAFGTFVAGDQRVLTVEGELDLAACPPFEKVLHAALAATPPGGELVVDLSDVRFFDVSALRTLLSATHAAQASHVPVRLVKSSTVDRMFEVLGIDLSGEPTQPAAAATPIHHIPSTAVQSEDI